LVAIRAASLATVVIDSFRLWRPVCTSLQHAHACGKQAASLAWPTGKFVVATRCRLWNRGCAEESGYFQLTLEISG